MQPKQIKTIAIFCGSNKGMNPCYANATRQFADYLVQAGITIVYGGAKVGLMGILAEQVLKQNGRIVGVIPQSLVDVEVAHSQLTEQYIVNSMHERKLLIAEKADAFIMLPGSSGSLDEFFEMHTLAYLGYHHKPCGILNIANYYDHLLNFLNHTVNEGFLKSVHFNMIIAEQTPARLMERLNQYQPPKVPKWIDALK